MVDFPPEFASQCCDAAQYLAQGLGCANTGKCYDSLRPIGSSLWFSMPFFAGIAPEWLTVIHAALLVLSAALAWRWLMQHSGSSNRIHQGLLLCAALLTHAIFMMPVLPYSLTDAPAGAFFLIGIWLVLLADKTPRWHYYAIAGLLLGAAPLLRAAYLYPVIGSLGVAAIMALVLRKQHKTQLALLLAAVPLFGQYIATWQHTGQWSFIDNSRHEQMLQTHLTDPTKGYDTIIMEGGYRWSSDCWPKGRPPVTHITDYTVKEFACLTWDKAHFYLGSYARLNYLNNGVIVDHLFRYRGNIGYWDRMVGFEVVHYDARNGITQLRVSREQPSLVAQTSAILSNQTPYTLHTTLWSNRPQTTNLVLISKTSREVLAHQVITLGTEPENFSITAKMHEPDRLLAAFGSHGRHTNTLGGSPDDTVWHKDTRLLLADSVVDPVIVRHWSNAWLATNIALVFCALWFFIRQKGWQQPGHVLAGLSCLLIVAQALLIVPEQRFVIAPMIIIWTLAAAAFSTWLSRKQTTTT